MLLALLLDASAFAGRTAVTTGEMLPSGHNERWFYLSTDGGPWTPTYAGTAWTPAAEGKLMNFRAANALFDDENRSDDDPEGNTDRFIANFDAYRAHGMLAFTTSLQGGNPGYEGAHVTAFRADGSLKSPWIDRAVRVIEAADARGMVVILTLFYQRQDQRIAHDDAVRRGVREVADWLRANDHRNVIIEISNEYQHTNFDRDVLESASGVASLIRLAKSRFDGAGWRPPVSASSINLSFDGAVRDASDLALIHGNGTTAATDAAAVDNLIANSAVNGPVVMNEDFQRDVVTSTALENEKLTASGIFAEGGSWGLMWRRYMQFYPFRWAPGTSADISGGSEANYLTAVLQHIASLTVAVAPSEPEPAPDPTPEPTPEPSPEPTPEAAQPAVTSFTLIDAVTDAPVPGYDKLPSGTILDLDQLPNERLNIRANTTSDSIGSVAFDLNGERFQVERNPPWAMAGNTGTDYHPWMPSPGSYVLEATPYSGDGATGTMGTPMTLGFEVVDSG